MKSHNDKIEKEFNKFTNGCIIASVIFLIILLFIGLGGVVIYKPVAAAFYYNIGIQAKANGHPKEAKQHLRKAIETDPGSKIAKKAEIFLSTKLPRSDNISDEAISYNIKGYNYDVNGDYEEALKYYEMAIKDSPEFEWPYGNIAYMYTYTKKDFVKARESVTKALALNPDYFNALNYSGSIYWFEAHQLKEEGNYAGSLELMEKALKEYEKARQLDPDDKWVKENVGKVKSYIRWLKEQLKKNS
jgi:tetratricopeptide (TPR) repeat protein